MFISRSIKRSKPSYDILKKTKKFEWTKEHEDGFQEIKKYLSSTSLLVKPLDGEPLLQNIFVSPNAISAILAKNLDRIQHTIYYVSKSLFNPETKYSHLEKLILALFTLLEEENMGKWMLFPDGASNFRGTGRGIMLKFPQGNILPHPIIYKFDAFNNEA